MEPKKGLARFFFTVKLVACSLCIQQIIPASRCRRLELRTLAWQMLRPASDLGVTTSENVSRAADMVEQAIKTGQSVL
jgi:hypothetical protein